MAPENLPSRAIHACLALVLLVLGGLGARWIVASAPDPARVEGLPGPGVVPVETQILRAADVPRVISATGTLEAVAEAALASEIGGRVVFVAEGLVNGASFSEADVLLKVDTAGLEAEVQAQATTIELTQAQLAAAEADLTAASKTLVSLEERRDLLRSEEDRWLELSERGMAEQARVDLARNQRLAADVTASDASRGLEAIRSTINAARLQVQLAENRQAVLATQLTQATVKAPFPGRFTSLNVPTVGTTLSPLVPFGALLDDRAMRLVTDVHEDDFAALSKRSMALAAPMSRPGTILEGVVSGLGARVDPVTRSVRVEALFEGPSPLDGVDNVVLDYAAQIPSGTFARVELRGEPFRDAIWVPESWVTYRDGQAVCFVVTGGQSEGGTVAELRHVEFMSGLHEEGRVIASGLAPGDRLITSSLQLLDEGAPVRVVAAPEGEAGLGAVPEATSDEGAKR